MPQIVRGIKIFFRIFPFDKAVRPRDHPSRKRSFAEHDLEWDGVSALRSSSARGSGSVGAGCPLLTEPLFMSAIAETPYPIHQERERAPREKDNFRFKTWY